VEWARWQAGVADMSMFFTTGFAPEKTTFPVTVAASDTVARSRAATAPQEIQSLVIFEIAPFIRVLGSGLITADG
jgi:hypothetical protein